MLALPTGASEQQNRDDREPGAAPPNCGRSHPGRLPAPTKKTGLTPANPALYSSFDHRWLWKLLPGESGTRREPEHNLAAPASIQTKGLQPKGLCILFSTSFVKTSLFQSSQSQSHGFTILVPPQPESLQSRFPNRRFLHITAGQTKTDEMHETADVSSPEYRVKPAKIFNIFSKQWEHRTGF